MQYLVSLNSTITSVAVEGVIHVLFPDSCEHVAFTQATVTLVHNLLQLVAP